MFRRSLYFLLPFTCVGSCFHLSCNDKPNRPTNEEEIRNTTQKLSTKNKQGIKNKTPTNKRCNFHRKRHCTYSHYDACSISPVTHSLCLTQCWNKTIHDVCPMHDSWSRKDIYKRQPSTLRVLHLCDLACDIGWPTHRHASSTAQHL